MKPCAAAIAQQDPAPRRTSGPSPQVSESGWLKG